MNVVLLICKYFGLLLAAVTSIWGTIHNLTLDLPGGKKRLTRAGLIAIGLTVAGLVVSIVSEDLQRRLAATEQMNQITAEAKRTNRIIVSAQPLTSLALSLRFESSDKGLRKTMEKGERAIQKNAESSQGGVPRVPFGVMEYQAQVIPLLQYLATMGHSERNKSERDENPNPIDGNSIIAVIPLDDSRNSVLSVGQLLPETDSDESDRSRKLPAGITTKGFEDLEGKTSPRLDFVAGNNEAAYELVWDLDPVTLKNAISQGVQGIHPTAKLPRTIKIAVLRGEPLPFEKNNFALPHPVNFWDFQRDAKGVQVALSRMELELKVNGSEEIRYKYKLEKIQRAHLADDFYGDLGVECTFLAFVPAE